MERPYTDDDGISRKWLNMAAERGNAEAQYCLGMYFSTLGEVEDALKWLRKATNQGHKNAKEILRQLEADL